MYPHVEHILKNQCIQSSKKYLDDEMLGSFKKAMQQKRCLSRLSKKVCILPFIGKMQILLQRLSGSSILINKCQKICIV